MTISIVKLEGQEVDDFVKKATQNKDFALLTEELTESRKISSTDYAVVNAAIGEIKGRKITFAVLETENNVKIIVGEINGQMKIGALLLEEENGQESLKRLDVVNNRVTIGHTIAYTEELKAALKNVKEQKLTVPSSISEDNQSEAVDDCWYGNWCGPGCSGPSAPIDGVDNCCKQHDLCYARYGYFWCPCDAQLCNCLAPYVNAGHYWAIAISLWFCPANCG